MPGIISYVNVLLSKYGLLKTRHHAISSKDVQYTLNQNEAQPAANNPACRLQRIANNPAYYARETVNNPLCRISSPAIFDARSPRPTLTITRMDELNFPVGSHLRGFQSFFINRCLDDFFGLCGKGKSTLKSHFKQSHNQWASESIRLYACTHYIISKLICFFENYTFGRKSLQLNRIKSDYHTNVTALANLALADDFSKENSRFLFKKNPDDPDTACLDEILLKISINLSDLSIKDNAINCRMANFFLLESMCAYLLEKFNILIDKELLERPFIHDYAKILFGSKENLQAASPENLQYPQRYHIRSTGFIILSLCRKIDGITKNVLFSDVIHELQQPKGKKPALIRLAPVPVSCAGNIPAPRPGNRPV